MVQIISLNRTYLPKWLCYDNELHNSKIVDNAVFFTFGVAIKFVVPKEGPSKQSNATAYPNDVIKNLT